MGEAPDSIVLRESVTDPKRLTLPDERDRLLHANAVSWTNSARSSQTSAPLPRHPRAKKEDIVYATSNRSGREGDAAARFSLLLVIGVTQLVELEPPRRGRARNGVALVPDRRANRDRDEAWVDGIDVVGVTSGASVTSGEARQRVFAFPLARH